MIDLVSMLNGTFSQWTGDNVDWDGKVKLHGMGAIVSTTGGNIDMLNSTLPILPRQKRKNVDEIVKGKGVEPTLVDPGLLLKKNGNESISVGQASYRWNIVIFVGQSEK